MLTMRTPGLWPSILLLLLAGFSTPAPAHDEPVVAAEMVQAASRLVATFTDEQKSAALLPWDSDQRQGWYYFPDKFIKPPGRRSGLPIGKMTPQQRPLVHALLSTALSHRGYQQATTIMAMERVLRDLDNDNPIRDPELYYLTIFGGPSVRKTWAWRVEGHHLSVNVTLVEGKHLAVTPSFFGSNPAKVPSGPWEGVRILGHEEDVARRLLKSLNEDQRKKAILSATAPQDIITSQDRKANKGVFMPVRGVPFAELDADQQKLLLELVDLFAHKHRHPIVAQIDARQKIADTSTMHFAWAGGAEPGQGHYFRVQTAAYIFEYDNTQDNANHCHAVWRSFDGDWGEDLLRAHYDKDHTK